MSRPTTLVGRCHCGNVDFRFETALAPDALPLRADQCSFCRRHGARTTSDPAGHVEITVHDAATVIAYRFGLRTADFLVCGRCGIYVAAIAGEDGGRYAVVNANTFDPPLDGDRPAEPVSYDGETADARRARRRARWTPATLRGLPGAAASRP